MRKEFLGFVAVAALSCGPGSGLAAAAAPASEPQQLSLTVYNSDLALVQDVRTLAIGQGRQRLEFKDVSARIRPETVSLATPDATVVEQNFDYDLLTPEKLMEKAVGKQVRIVRIVPGAGAQTTEAATVLSVNGGVVLKVGDHVEVLRQDDIPTRVIFDGIPSNLRAKPTLSVTVDSARAGTRAASLSYLTQGLSWKADYVALFDEASGKLDLQGWVTLTNSSGVDYPEARVQLVAGDVNLVGDEREFWQRRQLQANAVRRPGTGGPPGGETGPGQLADYYLYPLPGRTTVAENQTKQVSFLDAQGAQARKAYEYRAYGFQSLQTPANADVAVQFSNAGRAGLGHQLPAGIVRVYMRDAAGESRFVGENRIDHTPEGSDVSVKIGEAFDVTVQPTVVAQTSAGQTSAGKFRSNYRMSYLIRNAKAQPVTVTIRQGGLWREGKVLDESLKSRRLDAYNLAWDVPVPANGETTLTFTVDTGW